MKRGIAILLAVLALAGCQDEAQRRAETAANAANPEFVAKLADGRVISRVKIINADRDHFVYFVDNATVSTNQTIQEGKQYYNAVQVSLPANPSADDIIKEGERLKTETTKQRQALYQQLQHEFQNADSK